MSFLNGWNITRKKGKNEDEKTIFGLSQQCPTKYTHGVIIIIAKHFGSTQGPNNIVNSQNSEVSLYKPMSPF